MKKWILVLVFGLGLGISFSSFVFAEEEMPAMGNNPEQNQGQGMMGGGQGKGKMNPMMMGMMHKDSVVATSDGGVVILSGPRLLKYDKDLTLVKEVELPKGKGPAHPDHEVKNEEAAAPEAGSAAPAAPAAAEATAQ